MNIYLIELNKEYEFVTLNCDHTISFYENSDSTFNNDPYISLFSLNLINNHYDIEKYIIRTYNIFSHDRYIHDGWNIFIFKYNDKYDFDMGPMNYDSKFIYDKYQKFYNKLINLKAFT